MLAGGGCANGIYNLLFGIVVICVVLVLCDIALDACFVALWVIGFWLLVFGLFVI